MKDSLGMNVPEVLGKLYPNGEFVVWKPRMSQDSPLDSLPKIPGVIDYIGCIVDAEMPEGDFTTETVGHLGLSSDPILNLAQEGFSTARAVKGLAGITSYGRRMIRNGCYLLESRYPKEQLSFTTLTLPSLSMEEGRELQVNWSGFMQNFKNRFAKECKKQGLPLEYTYCVEIQELRSRSAGWPVLHLHLLFVGKNSKRGAWRIKTSTMDAMWKASIEAILRTTVDVKASCRMEQVEKSAEGYMSKYLTKGCSSLDAWRQEGLTDFFPSHWWGMSNLLRARVRASVYYGERVGVVLEALIEDKENVQYKRTIEVPWQGFAVKVGVYGRLKKGILSEVTTALDRTDELPF